MKTKPTEFKKYLDTEDGKRYMYIFFTLEVCFLIAIFTVVDLSFLFFALAIIDFGLLLNGYRLYLNKQKQNEGQ